jgi:FtsZ-binding cell division protein ZapB
MDDFIIRLCAALLTAEEKITASEERARLLQGEVLHLRTENNSLQSTIHKLEGKLDNKEKELHRVRCQLFYNLQEQPMSKARVGS